MAVGNDGHAEGFQDLKGFLKIKDRFGPSGDNRYGGLCQFVQVGGYIKGGFRAAVHAADAARRAVDTATDLGAKAIVAMTDSGSTALWMSRHRIHVPIYALTPRVATQRKMALYRNVRPLLMSTSTDRDTALRDAEQHLKDRGIVQKGDVYAITCGEPMGAPGGTNMMKICQVD